jgi:urease subunit alpha
MSSITREGYAGRYGPTTGDRIRLGDTNLWARITRDEASYGDETLIGFGKTVRDGLLAKAATTGDSELDLILTNAVIMDPVLGIFKGNIGIKDGRIVGTGRAGNPDLMDNVELLISTNTAIMPCNGLIVTPGGIDSHVHLMSPGVIPAALAAGITTIVAMGSGPTWDVGVNPAWAVQRMLEAFEQVPLNVAFLARGSSSRPEPLRRSIESGAAGLKIHEDVGASPAVVDCALSVAEEYDVAVAMHTDGLNEYGLLGETVAAIAGRAVHAYHAEGAGGGHAPNLLEILRQPHVLSSSTNPTIPYTVHTAAEHLEMILTVHSMDPNIPEDVAAARARIRPATMAAEALLHDLGAISMTSSDSQGMGRIGETILKTWQLAHLNKERRPDAADKQDDNERLLRYLAKYTINPAITHGLAAQVGSLEPGKLADLVVWQPAMFGVKPELVIKGGLPAWGVVGDGNAATERCQPLVYGAQYGAMGNATAALSASFVSQAALDSGAARRARSARQLLPVRGTRSIRKADMWLNALVPDLHVDPVTHVVTIGAPQPALPAGVRLHHDGHPPSPRSLTLCSDGGQRDWRQQCNEKKQWILDVERVT